MGACLLACLLACLAFPPSAGREKLGFGACLLAWLRACLAFPPIVGREMLGFGACLLAYLLACLALLPREGKEKLLFDPWRACLPILWVPPCTKKDSNQRQDVNKNKKNQRTTVIATHGLCYIQDDRVVIVSLSLVPLFKEHCT